MGSLVQQLVEGVLARRAGRAPDDRGRLVVDLVPVAVHPLAVRFHLELLQVGGKIAQVLAVRDHRAAPGAEEIHMPDFEQRKHHGHVVLERRRAEMLVHGARALEQLLESVHAGRQRDGQPHRGPDRVAPADPIPQRKHALGWNTERCGPRGVCGDRGEMARKFDRLPER